jgi:hypothetical protein
MTVRQLVNEIEDGSVLSDLSLASTTYTLLRRLQESPVIREAREAAASTYAHAFLDRAVRLLDSPAPEG